MSSSTSRLVKPDLPQNLGLQEQRLKLWPSSGSSAKIVESLLHVQDSASPWGSILHSDRALGVQKLPRRQHWKEAAVILRTRTTLSKYCVLYLRQLSLVSSSKKPCSRSQDPKQSGCAFLIELFLPNCEPTLPLGRWGPTIAIFVH